MSAIYSYSDSEKKLTEVSFPALVKHFCAERQLSPNKLSELVGRDRTFISRQIKQKNIPLPLIHLLSTHLSVNLFQYYQNLLPENIRPTKQELALREQIASLQKELADMTKERDLYKAIALK